MAQNVTIYGIANCDTMKKARAWLSQNGIDFVFHDYRKQGLDAEQLSRWIDTLGWQDMLNRRGTTWRKIADADKASIDRESAIQIMLDNPAIIKRPLLAIDDHLHLGFSDSQYSDLFKQT